MEHDAPVGSSSITRRRVVGTAATAAWAAPAIVMASAAPAMAVVSGQAPAAITTVIGEVAEVEGNSPTAVKVPVTFTNAGGATTSLRADVMIAVLPGGVNQSQPTVISSDWALEGMATFTQTNALMATFVKRDPQVGATPATSLLEFTFSAFFTNGLRDGSITVTPRVTGAPGSSGTADTRPFALNAVGP